MLESIKNLVLTKLTSLRRPSWRSKSCSTALKEKEMEKNMVAWQTPAAWDDSSSHRAYATMSDSTPSCSVHTYKHTTGHKSSVSFLKTQILKQIKASSASSTLVKMCCVCVCDVPSPESPDCTPGSTGTVTLRSPPSTAAGSPGVSALLRER